MATYTKAAVLVNLKPGEMKTFRVSGKVLALANVSGEIFAVDDVCTHEDCSLGGEGFLDGNAIICGCHGAQFDVTSGKVLTPPATVDLKTYKTKVDGENILVEV